MSIMTQDVGAVAFLAARFNNSWPANKDLTLKLFVNNVTPNDTDTAGTYTEAAGGGYVAKTLTAGSWTCSTISNIAQAAYAAQTFTFTGQLTTNQTVYGWFVVDGNGVVQFSDLLRNGSDVSYTYSPQNNGDTLTMTPVYQLSKGTPA